MRVPTRRLASPRHARRRERDQVLALATVRQMHDERGYCAASQASARADCLPAAWQRYAYLSPTVLRIGCVS